MRIKTKRDAMAAVEDDGELIEYVPNELVDEDICLAAVQENGNALRLVPDEFKTPGLCLEAVRQNGKALEFVPEALQESVKEWADAGLSEPPAGWTPPAPDEDDDIGLRP